MPVTSDVRETKMAEALVNCLAACAAWRTQVGAADATAAKAFIVEQFGGRRGDGFVAVDGTTLDTAGSWAMVKVGAFRSERRAHDSYGWSCDAEIILNVPVVTADTAPEQLRRARNLQGAVRGQMQAQWGSTSPHTAPVAGEIEPQPVIISDDTGKNRLHLVAVLSLTLFDL